MYYRRIVVCDENEIRKEKGIRYRSVKAPAGVQRCAEKLCHALHDAHPAGNAGAFLDTGDEKWRNGLYLQNGQIFRKSAGSLALMR